MFSAARLRLTLWYLAVLATIVVLLSVALYDVLLRLQQAEAQALGRVMRHGVAQLMARDERALAEQIGQTLEVALEGLLPVAGDRVKLRQALANLLDNAVTYTPQGGTICLTAHRERRRAVLAVRDTGPGIAAQYLPHLFEPF